MIAYYWRNENFIKRANCQNIHEDSFDALFWCNQSKKKIFIYTGKSYTNWMLSLSSFFLPIWLVWCCWWWQAVIPAANYNESWMFACVFMRTLWITNFESIRKKIIWWKKCRRHEKYCTTLQESISFWACAVENIKIRKKFLRQNYTTFLKIKNA